MTMLKTLDAEIRKLSAQGMYYKDIAKALAVGAPGVYLYMRDKGIKRNLIGRSCTGEE